MEQPKQLLPLFGKPLLRHVLAGLAAAPVSPIFVVLGADAGQIRGCLQGLNIEVIVNEGWKEGIGSSIRVGVEALRVASPGIQGVVIALGDQPNFSALHVTRLLDEQIRSGRTIVATESAGILSAPVYFSSEHFTELLALRGDVGARNLLQAHREEIAVVTFADLVDLDTKDDYIEFLKMARPS